ncbi:hypothetical protein EYC84_011476 [Monilinia fructicola]|uniref:Uncharacterized protein n=1 Tax=Monilinia fructicola TaxID=38448 RepID=A0A5M9JA78_MONFR|nr:hypothetical protein EYC84_011476 [Monilinia fructicola]
MLTQLQALRLLKKYFTSSPCPPIMNEIVKGIDHLKSWNPDTAKEYINRAQKEIGKGWKTVTEWWAMVKLERKGKEDEHDLKKVYEDLFRLKGIEPEKRKKRAKTKCDVIGRFFDSMIKKREDEYEKTTAWLVKTKCDAVVQTFESISQAREMKKMRHQMAVMDCLQGQDFLG